jgi:heterodisulfide reductase subunit B
VLLEDVGIKDLQKRLTRPLQGLKVACYYGCYLVRPAEVTGFDNPENPTSLDRLVTAMGGESLDWPGKVDCCGGALSLTRTDTTVKLSAGIIEMAAESGAACITVACPMCQSSLDLRQKEIEKTTGKRFNMPVLYITQLLGLCLGISPKELGIGRLMVAPAAVLEAVKC